MLKFFCSIAFLALLSSVAYASRTVSETGTEVGRYAPAVELTDLWGNNVSLESLRGSVVVLNFSSAVCAPCMAEMPSLNRLQADLGSKGLQVVSIAIDPSDALIRDYALKYGIIFTVLLDSSRETFAGPYNGPRLPASYLIDKNGVIVEKFTGLQVWDGRDMKSRILMLLEKK